MNDKNKIEPIRPEDIDITLPDFVISGANECIKDHYRPESKMSKFTQDELINYILERTPSDMNNITRETLFKNHWLDIEPLYRDAGWNVYYDKPLYNEMRPAMFYFNIESK